MIGVAILIVTSALICLEAVNNDSSSQTTVTYNFQQRKKTLDPTMQAGQKGYEVVEAALSKIEESCIFRSDKMFLRHMAYVESNNGLDPKTYEKDYYGGIWKIDRSVFDIWRKNYGKRPMDNGIKEKLKVDLSTLKWEDLLKPLHSALVARLIINYNNKYKNDVPVTLEDQAKMWKQLFRSNGKEMDFVNKAKTFKSECTSAVGSDIFFVLDGSGSIGYNNFKNNLNFLKKIIRKFKIGKNVDETQIGVIQFSDRARTEIKLGQYNTYSELDKAIDKIRYANGMTYTNMALDLLHKMGFTEKAGARPTSNGHRRIAVLITDGASTHKDSTITSAAEAKAKKIYMIAVGVGRANYRQMMDTELRVIASSPQCVNVVYVDTYAEVPSLIHTIERFSCRVPLEPPAKVKLVLNNYQSQNLKFTVPKNGLTLSVHAEAGDAILYTDDKSQPSQISYKQKYNINKYKSKEIFVKFEDTKGGVLYASITAGHDCDKTDVTIDQKPGSHLKNSRTCICWGSFHCNVFQHRIVSFLPKNYMLMAASSKGNVIENKYPGSYKLATDDGSFRIYIRTKLLNTNETFINRVEIHYQNAIVNFILKVKNQPILVQVKGQTADFERYFSVSINNRFYEFRTSDNGLVVSLNNEGHFIISLSEVWNKKVYGFCGLLNDDYFTKQSDVEYTRVYGSLFTNKLGRPDDSDDPRDEDDCLENNDSNKEGNVKESCKFTSSTFESNVKNKKCVDVTAECKKITELNKYFESCLFKLYSPLAISYADKCSNDIYSGSKCEPENVCEVYSSFATLCNRVGVSVGKGWRDHFKCSCNCPHKGMVCVESGSPCVPSCLDPHAVDRCSHDDVQDVCQCPPGKLLQDNECVESTYCGCFVKKNDDYNFRDRSYDNDDLTFYKVNDVWQSRSNCSIEYKCNAGNIVEVSHEPDNCYPSKKSSKVTKKNITVVTQQPTKIEIIKPPNVPEEKVVIPKPSNIPDIELPKVSKEKESSVNATNNETVVPPKPTVTEEIKPPGVPEKNVVTPKPSIVPDIELPKVPKEKVSSVNTTNNETVVPPKPTKTEDIKPPSVPEETVVTPKPSKVPDIELPKVPKEKKSSVNTTNNETVVPPKPTKTEGIKPPSESEENVVTPKPSKVPDIELPKVPKEKKSSVNLTNNETVVPPKIEDVQSSIVHEETESSVNRTNNKTVVTSKLTNSSDIKLPKVPEEKESPDIATTVETDATSNSIMVEIPLPSTFECKQKTLFVTLTIHSSKP